MDLQLLFTAERLQLNPLLTKGAVRKGRYTIKTIDTGGYLTIDELQWQVLAAFTKPKTVPDVLQFLITERICPALHDFYELIIKAHRAGVLQTAPSPAKQVTPLDWKLGFPPKLACWLGALMLAATLLVIGVRPPHVPGGTWTEIGLTLLAGYFGTAVAVSLGTILSASVLHSAGGDASRPHLSWSWGLPRFNLDLRDSLIVDACAQRAIQLVRSAPLGALVIGLCFWRPQAALLPTVLFALLVRPFFGGPVSHPVNAGLGKPVLDTSSRLLFPANRNWAGLWRTARLQFDLPVVITRLVWGVLWTGGITLLGSQIAGVPIKEMIMDRHFWRVFGVVFAIVAAIPTSVFAFVATVESLREPIRKIKKLWRLRQLRKRAVFQPVTMKTITGILAVSPICQQLPADRRRALADAVNVVTLPRGSFLADFNKPASEIYIIVSGAVDVFRRTQKGRPQRVWQAIEGDIVGAEELVEPRPLGWKLKTRTPVIALRVPRAVFEKEIVARMGSEAAQALIHRVPFLRQNHLCRNWHPQAINRFAGISRLVTYTAGSDVLIEKHDSQGLFFIYEGQAEVTRQKRRLSRLGIGGFIGEIGLLQNSASTATVVADGPLSCLAIDKTVFFRFLTQNYDVGLEVERLSSQRLGRPVFPLNPGSFEVR
jgi:CRP-like cAMP-binding protein